MTIIIFIVLLIYFIGLDNLFLFIFSIKLFYIKLLCILLIFLCLIYFIFTLFLFTLFYKNTIKIPPFFPNFLQIELQNIKILSKSPGEGIRYIISKIIIDICILTIVLLMFIYLF